MSAIDFGLLLAVWASGWGLSLIVYRWVACFTGWPMGEWQRNRPRVVVRLGLACVASAWLFASFRASGGYLLSASLIPLFGAAWAVFWVGFLRVGAQSALLLAPIAAGLLLIRWLT